MVYTNKLINETSPYLLQHAHNPVDWYPWGQEALEKAKQEDKPILVSIGYAACHWCHVMERESFENPETAQLMNEHFINIKIDREERPDLDHIYMDAVQAMTGSGGWPLNVFLTPEAKPFFGGTYFPPVKAYNRSSWTDILQSIQEAYKERKHEIESQAGNIIAHLNSSNAFGIAKPGSTDSPTVFTAENAGLMATNILKQADTEWGGFGNAPKFPQTASIQFLLRHYHFTKDQDALQQALLSLDKMIQGGIYDQIGGGFSRYSTDANWLAPHFEKMLYDNALLIGVLSEAHQLTKKESYAATIHQTMKFIQREMTNAQNGFYSALDADSEGVEGKFYTWSKKEIDAALGNDAAIFCEVYNVSEQGNWEHTNILWLTKPIEEEALEKGWDIVELSRNLQQSREKLLQQRNLRIRPQLDDKVLLGWNALMNTACSKAYAALGKDEYRQLAISNMQFMEQCMANGQHGFYHTYKDGIAKIPAFLDDYAFLIQAYIHLQEITGESTYLTKAKKLTDFVIENFSEEESGYFFYTNKAQDDIIVRKKEVYDGATPSGNACMALNLNYLTVIFDDYEYGAKCNKMVESLGNAIVKYPTSFGVWASYIQQRTEGINEIVVVGKNFTQTLPSVLSAYIPNKIMQASVGADSTFPLLRGKNPIGGTCYYLCRDYVCNEQETDLERFLANM